MRARARRSRVAGAATAIEGDIARRRRRERARGGRHRARRCDARARGNVPPRSSRPVRRRRRNQQK
eukprot:31304-Pelagococcus_subviridis.AAC.13